MRGGVGRAACLRTGVAAAAVRVQHGIQHAVSFFRGFQQHGARSVAEDRACIAVVVVDDRRHLIGSDDDDFLEGSGLDIFRSRVERKQETAASGRQIESERVFHPCFVAGQVGRRREKHVRRDRRADDHLDVERIGIRLFEQVLDGPFRHVGGPQTLAFEDMAGLDSDTGHDPFVGRVHHMAQLDVVQDIVGQIRADARDCCGFLLCH